MTKPPDILAVKVCCFTCVFKSHEAARNISELNPKPETLNQSNHIPLMNVKNSKQCQSWSDAKTGTRLSGSVVETRHFLGWEFICRDGRKAAELTLMEAIRAGDHQS